MFINATTVPVAVATTDIVMVADTTSARALGLSLVNSGANALDAFEVWGRFSPAGPSVKLASVAGDFTTPVFPIVKASGSPLNLAAAATAWMFMDVSALAEVSLKASSAVGVTTLNIHAAVKDVS